MLLLSQRRAHGAKYSAHAPKGLDCANNNINVNRQLQQVYEELPPNCTWGIYKCFGGNDDQQQLAPPRICKGFSPCFKNSEDLI